MRSRAYCGNHRPATGTEKQQCLDDGYPARHPHPAIFKFSTLEKVTHKSTAAGADSRQSAAAAGAQPASVGRDLAAFGSE